ncbi:MAG: hypothetical protein V7637_1966 [Mycobacteriales bacterium]|jgi:hypothetical protein
MPRWHMTRPGALSEVDEQLARLAEQLRELRRTAGQPDDESLLWCHIDLLLDERQSRWPGATPIRWQRTTTAM